MLGVSIAHRSIRGLLFAPLEYNQVAPPGFVVASKVSTILFGSSDFAIRLPAFICAIAALLAFALLARRVLQNEEIIAAVCVFALSPMLVIYSAELKQYSGDVLVAVLLTLTTLKVRASTFERRWVYATAAAGMLAVWFSDSAVLVIAGLSIGLIILASLERDAHAARAASIIGPAWAIAIAAHQIGAQARITAETKVVMHNYWTRGFMPFPQTDSDLRWLPRTFNRLYADGLGVRPLGGGVLLLAIAGAFVLWRRGRRDIVFLIAAPVVVAVIASAVRVYPLSGRVSMFLLPALTIFFAAGVGVLASSFRRWAPLPALVLLIALVNIPQSVYRGTPPPWVQEDVRPALQTIRSDRQPGDRFYVYWGAVPVTDYYAARYGIDSSEWEAGMKPQASPTGFSEDLVQYRGARRLWLLFSHSDARERAEVLVRVDGMGGRLMSDTTGYDRASVSRAPLFLYDLSEQQQPLQ